MKVVMVSSESLPFAKVGGLGDVVYSLSRKLVSRNVKVSIVMPFYKCIKENVSSLEEVASFNVKMSWRNQPCKIFHLSKDRIDFYFINSDYYFSRDKIYGENDDFERFIAPKIIRIPRKTESVMTAGFAKGFLLFL